MVPVTDLAVKDNDLVAATNGRSFWILGDLAVLRQLRDDVAGTPVHLFAPPPTYRVASRWAVGRQPGPGKNYVLDLGSPATFYEDRTASGEAVKTMLETPGPTRRME